LPKCRQNKHLEEKVLNPNIHRLADSAPPCATAEAKAARGQRRNVENTDRWYISKFDLQLNSNEGNSPFEGSGASKRRGMLKQMSSHVEQIKSKLDIVDVVGSYIELEKAGGNYKAKCPFHNEKSPSFFVSPARNSYYCFGCAAKGDIFTFVQEFEGLDFVGALRVLAKRAGVELKRENPTIRTERERLYLTMEHATLFYQRQLQNNKEALEYLKKRGLSDDTIKEWRIGFSSVDWRTLFAYLTSKKVSSIDMEKVGLIKKSEKAKGDYYDRFRGRIMFPLFDSSGRVVAFSGRQFLDDGTQAKYLNSPETSLFEKSKILYGFDRAKLNIRKENYSLLVEGQMDLLMSHQTGFTNAVASSGTALTTQHLEILRRLSNKIVIAYDGDDAGGAAAARGWQLALNLGMDVKIASLPEGKDPADVVLEDPKKFAEAIKHARHIIDVELEKLLKAKLDDRERKIKIEKELLPYVAGLESLAEKSHFISEISFKSGMKEDILWDIVRKASKSSLYQTVGQPSSTVEKIARERKDGLIRMIFGLIFWYERSDSTKSHGLDIRQKICTIIDTDTVARFERSFDTSRDDLIFEAEAYYAQSNDITRHIDELIRNLKEELLREEFSVTMHKLQIAEREKDDTMTLELLKRCQELSLELRNLNERS
jgi:DNA primase